ncbi:MAG TPA: hypothetical protein VGR20_18290 [Acidimicrobiia bacterium]|nr:hypothetical protein [Acidimicrobiia bacterium]
MARNRILAGAIVAFALLATACGGGSGGKKAAPATGGSSVTTAAPSSTAAPAAKGAVDPNAPEVNESGDIPDNQVFVPYALPAGGFTVKVPEGWARSESGGAVVFTDKLNSIRLETVDAAAAPTVASVTQTDLPAIRAAAQNFEPGTVKMVTRKAGSAVLATYRADAAPNPVTGKVVHDEVERYVFWRAGKAAILTLAGPQGADNVDPWRIVTDAFGWQ